MKKLLVLGTCAAIAVISAGCSGVSQFSDGTSPGATARQVATSIFASPDRQHKIGPYIWVWREVKVHKDAILEADCPVNYAVVGGGFRGRTLQIRDTHPNHAFTGWIVSVYGGHNGTVFASCAPVK
jgi:hypothetical protein